MVWVTVRTVRRCSYGVRSGGSRRVYGRGVLKAANKYPVRRNEQ